MRAIAAGLGLLFSSLLFMASSMGVVEILGAWRKGEFPSYYQKHWEVFWSVIILNCAALVILAFLGRSLWPRRGFSGLKPLGFGCFLISYLVGYFLPSIL